MSNYDYNKGYRWFRFQKDSTIDSSLPALSSYRSTREINPILWMTTAEHVANNERGHVHCDSSVVSRTHEAPSLHLPIILTASISNGSHAGAPSLNVQDTDGYTEYGGNTDTLAFPLYIPTPTVLMGSDTAGPVLSQQSVVKRTPVHKTRTKRTVARKPSRDRANHKTQTSLDLQDCLFIQNGIQRFPANRKGFLSAEKEMDIKEWINGAKPSSK